jgi:uncharacterized protein YacL
MSNGRYSIRVLIASILAGVLYYFIGEIIYKTLKVLEIPRVILTGAYFTGFFLVLGLVLFFVVKSMHWIKDRQLNVKQWLLFLVLMIVCSMLFEFIYDLVINRKKAQEIDSYIFLLDYSGSMDINDPNGMRYDAVDKLLENKPDDFPYAIYVFENDTIRLRDMLPKSEQVDFEYPANAGGTNIYYAFKTIMRDIKSGELTIGKNCRIIFLTDGVASDIWYLNKASFIRSLDEYVEKDISISTVGLLNSDEQLMTAIAEKTDGVFISVDNIDQLEDAIRTAGTVTNKYLRDLLGYRNGDYLNWLLAIMRIVFVALLGMIIGLQKATICDRFLNTNSVVWASLVLSAIAGVFIEVGMNTFGMNENIVRAITCVLIAFTLLKDDPANLSDVGARVKDYAD